MGKLAHTHNNIDDIIIDPNDHYTLLLCRNDGKFDSVSTKDMPAYLDDEDRVIDMAMLTTCHSGEECEVYWYGVLMGKAHYADMTPHSRFSSVELVFSKYLAF